MLNNKKIFFYFIFVLNIIFFIKSADMEIDNDDINDPTKKIRSESTPMDVDVDVEDAQDDCAIKKLQLNGLFITREQYKSMKKFGLVPSFSDDLEGGGDFPVSETLDIPINGDDVSAKNSLDHNGSDNDLKLNILIDTMSKRLELTNEQMKLLDQLIKKAVSGSKLTEEEIELFKIFFNYGCNFKKHRNLLFEECDNRYYGYSYKFKNGEGTINVKYNEGELVCDCGIVVTNNTVTTHMIKHSKLREAIGHEKCSTCKIPSYCHSRLMKKHIKDCHAL